MRFSTSGTGFLRRNASRGPRYEARDENLYVTSLCAATAYTHTKKLHRPSFPPIYGPAEVNPSRPNPATEINRRSSPRNEEQTNSFNYIGRGAITRVHTVECQRSIIKGRLCPTS